MYRYVYLYIYIRFMHILYIHILHMYMIIINHYSHISPGHQPFCVHLGSCPSQVFKKNTKHGSNQFILFLCGSNPPSTPVLPPKQKARHCCVFSAPRNRPPSPAAHAPIRRRTAKPWARPRRHRACGRWTPYLMRPHKRI